MLFRSRRGGDGAPAGAGGGALRPPSSGASVVAARRLAARLGPAATVVTLLVDSGLKYLTTDVYRNAEQAALSETLRLMSPEELGMSRIS